MKKFIKIIAISLVCFLSFACNNKAQWIIKYEKGDEMLNIPSYYSCFYRDALSEDWAGYMTDSKYFVIYSSNDIFDYDYDGYDTETIDVTIGYYKSGQLVKKEDTKAIIGKSEDVAYFSAMLSDKIITYLKNEGDGRIYARKYTQLNYDVKIPMNKNLK